MFNAYYVWLVEVAFYSACLSCLCVFLSVRFSYMYLLVGISWLSLFIPQFEFLRKSNCILFHMAGLLLRYLPESCNIILLVPPVSMQWHFLVLVYLYLGVYSYFHQKHPSWICSVTNICLYLDILLSFQPLLLDFATNLHVTIINNDEMLFWHTDS